jgi:TPR repeat protein
MRIFCLIDPVSIRVLLTASVLAFLPVAAVAQSFEDGLAAAQQGDPATAIAVWTPLAQAGDPRAQYWLAESFWGGWWGGTEDLERRAFWHRRAADQGHVPSFVKLGDMYTYGQHVTQDLREAAAWYARAADAANADGRYALGSAYLYGQGVPADRQRAFALWRQAAAQGHEGARIELCREAGEGCTD